jgi:hypothetical protein
MHWVNGPSIPVNATVGGSENGRPLYVCHSSYNGGIHPGKIVAGNCNISYGGRELPRPNFEVLTGSGIWKAAQPQFEAAFAAGQEQSSPLYLCRAAYNGGIHPGKVVAGRCNIGWGGAEVVLSAFEVFYASERSLNSNTPVVVVFRNATRSVLDVFWVDFHGSEVSYGKLAPAQNLEQQTYGTHRWVFRESGRAVGEYAADSRPVQHFGIGISATTAQLQAGPVWDNNDARTKCPTVCRRSAASWNGAWRTTEWGKMSTCDCVGFF